MVKGELKWKPYISRRRLRSMRRGEMIHVDGLSIGAVCSARVQCHAIGRERGCHYSLAAIELSPGLYRVEITRMTIADALALGLMRRRSE